MCFRILIVLFLMLVLPASAQMAVTPNSLPVMCFSNRGEFIKHFMERYKEAPKYNGITNDETSLIEVWTTVDGSKWSVTLYDPEEGRTCILAAGRDWRSLLWYIPQGREVHRDG